MSATIVDTGVLYPVRTFNNTGTSETTSPSNIQRKNIVGVDFKLIGDVQLRGNGNGRYVDVKTNIADNHVMFHCMVHGYLYGNGLMYSLIGGYTYSSNTILNKYTHNLGHGYVTSYRSSGGHLCLKIDRGTNGYTEGRVSISYNDHGHNKQGDIVISRIKGNDSSVNYYA